MSTRQAKAALVELSKSFPPGLNTPSRSTPPPWSATRSRSAGHPRRSHRHRHRGHLPLPARLARHHHSRRHHSGFAHRHLRVHQGLRLLHQLAHALRHHAGHRPGGRRRHRGHRKRAAPHRHGALRSARGHVARHGRGHQRGHRHLAGAHRRVRAGLFFPGTTGILYRQFSLTIAFAIAISAFNALTLSPALSALFLRGEEDRPISWISSTSACLARLCRLHSRGRCDRQLAVPHLRQVHPCRSASCATCCCWSFSPAWAQRFGCISTCPPASFRRKTRATSSSIVQAPPGSSLAYTTALATARRPSSPRIRLMADVLRHGLWLFRRLFQRRPHVCRTKPSDQRRGKGHSAADIVADLSPKLQSLMFAPNGGLVAIFQPPAVQGVGSFGGFPVHAPGPGRQHLTDLDRVAHQIVGSKPPARI
jgi:hypothetical protein